MGWVVLVGISAVIAINAYVIHYAAPFLTHTAFEEQRSMQEQLTYDAGIILWASVFMDGTLSPVLQARVDAAIALLQAGTVERILISWDGVEDDVYKETPAMYKYITQHIVDNAQLIVDPAGVTTYDSMRRAKHLYGIERALVFTQAFHLSRSVYIARRLGIDAWGYAVDQYIPPHRKYLVPRELAARVKAWIDVEIWQRWAKYGTKILTH